MKMRSVIFGMLLALLIRCPLPIYAAVVTDTFHAAYQQTTLLTLEADLRLHLCHLKEFSYISSYSLLGCVDEFAALAYGPLYDQRLEGNADGRTLAHHRRRLG